MNVCASVQYAAERPTSTRLGVACGVGAYLAWGLVAIYFKQVSSVPALAILAHRIVWSVVFLSILVTAEGLWGQVTRCVRNGTTLAALAGSTIAVGVNWYTFIYAIGSQRMLQSSLGYFIAPLMSVALGVIVLGERLRRWQWVGLGLAGVCVAMQMVGGGEFPWIALLLAITFSTYGLLRKQMQVGPLIGGMVETMLLLPFGLIVAGMQLRHDVLHHTIDARVYALLPLAGVVTAGPLLLFARAARSLRLSTMGFLQYLSPVGQFLVALAYHETISPKKLLSFALIWAALAIYSIDSWRAGMARRN